MLLIDGIDGVDDGDDGDDGLVLLSSSYSINQFKTTIEFVSIKY
jgi:hypothetical protein